MYRVIATSIVTGLLTLVLAGCKPTTVTQSEGGAASTEPRPAPVPAPVVAPPADALTSERLKNKTFIYNHSLVDGALEGASVRLGADGKLTGAEEQTAWRVDAGVLYFEDANGTVRSRFDKVYSGPAGLFFLGHRTSDNKYHTLLELPPTK